MAKILFLVAFVFGCCYAHDAELKEILTSGGEDATTVVDFNKVKNHGRQTRTGAISFEPMECNVKKYPGVKFYGRFLRFEYDVPNPDICASICYQYKMLKKEPCESINFSNLTNRCELNSNMLDVNDPDMFDLYARKDRFSTYIIPIKCSLDGNPLEPEPVEPVDPSDPIKPVDPANPDSGSKPVTPGGTPVPTGSCGKAFVTTRLAPKPHQRIVGGTEARPHSFPWIVSLQQFNSPFCGGSLIRVGDKEESDIIVTAAHCLFPKPYRFSVLLGAHSFIKDEEGQEDIPVESYAAHETYNDRQMWDDIAILKLLKPVKFSNTIQPVCLPQADEEVKVGDVGIVSGWGAMREKGSGSQWLMQVNVPAMNTTTCGKTYKDLRPSTQICAGYEEGMKDSCQGDSGGPLIFSKDGQYSLHGVVSYGYGCARRNNPGVYTKISKYLGWINSKIASMSSLV